MEPDCQSLMQLVRDRRSVRRFTDQPVSDEAVLALLDAARWAPSPGNRQAFRVVVVRSPEVREAMATAVDEAIERIRQQLRPGRAAAVESYLPNFTHFRKAPVVLVVTCRPGSDLMQAAVEPGAVLPGPHGRHERDAQAAAAAATMSLLLAAHALGLGACWMTGPLYAEAALRELLAVPKSWQISAVVPVGWPDEQPEAPRRRDLAQTYRTV